MKTNDLKKGTRVVLRSGFYATLLDNQRGNTRMADVEGICRESGSVYAHDIVLAREVPNASVGSFVYVEHTPAQLKLRKMVEAVL